MAETPLYICDLDGTLLRSDGAPGRNVELKARDPIPQRSLAACEELGAESHGTLVQRDTYFQVPKVRLKLREEEGAVSHLIAYERPNHAGQRESRYRIVKVDQPDELVAALSSVLGVKAVIEKASAVPLGGCADPSGSGLTTWPLHRVRGGRYRRLRPLTRRGTDQGLAPSLRGR